MVALALSCGGNDSNDSASNAPGGSSVAMVNFSESTAKLMELKSFRFDLTLKLDLGSLGNLGANSDSAEDALGQAFAAAMLGILGDIKAEGAFVAPDQMDVRMTLAGQQMGYVQLGTRAWVNDGSGWEATTSAADMMTFGESPADLFNEFLPQDVLRGARTSGETVNGVKTTRYSFDKKALEQIADEMGESADLEDVTEANLDIWLTEGEIPVKVTMKVAGKDETGQTMSMNLEVNVRDINSNSIQIKSPI
jgi:hypothetical protein